jgi:hypothetical protein
VPVVTGAGRPPTDGSRFVVGRSDDLVLETCLVLTSMAMRTDMTMAHDLHFVQGEQWPAGQYVRTRSAWKASSTSRIGGAMVTVSPPRDVAVRPRALLDIPDA